MAVTACGLVGVRVGLSVFALLVAAVVAVALVGAALVEVALLVEDAAL